MSSFIINYLKARLVVKNIFIKVFDFNMDGIQYTGSLSSLINVLSKVSAVVEWLEYSTLVREGPGSRPVRVRKNTRMHIFDGCSRITS